MKYKVGDKVLIKPYEDIRKNSKADFEGVMAKNWGGKVMTINSTFAGYYEMEEDLHTGERMGGWCWLEDMIEGLATTINVTTDDLLNFISS